MKLLTFLIVLLTLVNYGHSQFLASMGDEVWLVEGGPGSFPILNFPVYMSQPVLTTSNVTFQIVAGTAMAGVDFLVPQITTVTFLPGSNQELIKVPIVGDSDIEDTETFDVLLTGGTGVTVTFPFASRGYIVNDDGVGASLTAQQSVREALSAMSFNVSLATAASTDVSFWYRAYSRSSDTATLGVDYDGVDNTATIKAGSLSTTVTIGIFDDGLAEGDETFTIELYRPNKMWFINSTSGATEFLRSVFTIIDDDVALMISDVSLVEGTGTNTSFVFTVSLSKALTAGQSAIVSLAIFNVTTDSSDFADTSALKNNLTFAAGDQSKTVTIVVFGDSVVESTETFELQATVLSSVPESTVQAGYHAAGTGTIINDDSNLSLLMTRNNANNVLKESGGTITFTVTPSGSNTGGPTGSYTISVASGSATNGLDFQTTLVGTNNLAGASQTISWSAGATPGIFTFNVTLLSDTLQETDETFTVSLSNPVSATLTAPTSFNYTIQDSTVVLTVGNAVSMLEGNGGSGSSNSLVFPISLNLPAPQALNLSFQYDNTSSPTVATPGVDYTGPAWLLIPVGATSTSLTVSIMGDSMVEENETVIFALGTIVPDQVVMINNNVGRGMILNDDTYVYVGDTEVYEGDVGVTSAVVRIYSPTPFAAGATVTYFTPASIGTAVQGVDYTAAQSTVNLPAGASETMITVFILADTIPEATVTFTVQLTSGSGGVSPGTPNFGTVTIINDDGPSLSVADVAALENSGLLTFTLTLDSTPLTGASVLVSTGNLLSATPMVDFTAFRSMSVVWGVGTTNTSVNVTVIDDPTPEQTETVTLVFNYPNYIRVPPTLLPTGRIVNDDGVRVGFLSSSQYVLPEGNSGNTSFTFVIGAVGSTVGLDSNARVYLETIAGTAVPGKDYYPVMAQSVSIGTSPTTVTVQVIGDTIPEPTVTYMVRLYYPDYVFFNSPVTIDSSVTAKILGDDYFANISSVSLIEGDVGDPLTVFVFTLTFTGPASEGTTLSYKTQDGTAISSASTNNDYQAIAPVTVNITTGVVSYNISVNVIPDNIPEVNETFSLMLTNSYLLNLGSPSIGVGTIINDDFTLNITDQSIFEGDTIQTITFTFLIDGPAKAGASFRVQTQDGTAMAGVNYIGFNNVVNLTTGVTSVNISVTIMGDTLPGPSVSFSLVFSQVSHIILSTTTASVTIINDDGPVITVASASALEGNTTAQQMVFVVTSTGPVSTGAAGFWVQTKKITAQVGDFVEISAPTFVNFTAGQTTARVTVLTIPDQVPENTVTFNLVVTNPSYVQFGANATASGLVALGTMINDDGLPVSLANFAQPEGTSNLTTPFLLTLNLVGGGAPAGASADFSIMSGTATPQVDYMTTSGTFIFSTGATSATAIVQVVADSLDEPPETFFVTLSNPNKININAFTNATVTILNDDGVISVSSPKVLEGAAGTTTPMVFNISLSSPAPASPGLASFTWSAVGVNSVSGVDFVPASGTFTFSSGTTFGTITVTVIGNDAPEADKTVTLMINSVSNAMAPVRSFNGTILNDDVQLNVMNQAFYEGDTSFIYQFPIYQTATSTASGSVTYNVTALTAVNGRDFQLNSNTTLPLNQTGLMTYINFTIFGDTIPQGDKSFKITLVSCFGCVIGNSSSATVTLWEDDYSVSFALAAYTVTEADSGTTNMSVSLTTSQPLITSGPTPQITLSTADGTALNPGDYLKTSTTITFSSGASSANFTVPIVGDTVPEPTETFSISLSSPIGLKIANPGTTIVTILDNDARLIRVSDPSIFEGGDARTFQTQVVLSNMTFIVSLSGPAMANSSVTYTTADGTATSTGSQPDYIPVTGSHSFALGETQFSIQVPVYADYFLESSETVILHIVSYTGALVTDPSTDGTGTIINDDFKAFGISAVARGKLRVNNKEVVA